MTRGIDDPLACIASIDAKIAATGDGRPRYLLGLLRRRLTGEILGDIGLILGAVTENFRVVSTVDGATSPEQSREDFDAAMTAFFSSGATMWVSWTHLVADDSGVAGDGLLISVPRAREGQAEIVSNVQPLTVFIEYGEKGMSAEYAYVGKAAEGPIFRCDELALQSQALRSQR